MNSAFHKDESEFAVFVFSVLLQVLSHLDSFLDEMIQIFRDLWCQAIHSENAKDLVLGDGPDLGNSMLIPQQDTDLRQRQSLSGKLADHARHLLTGEL